MRGDGLTGLRELLRAEGGLMATLVAPERNGDGHPRDGMSPAVLAAGGPRAEGRRGEYELLIEAMMVLAIWLTDAAAPSVTEPAVSWPPA